MYGKILKNKDGGTAKILSHHQDIYIISFSGDYKTARGSNYTKEQLISSGWIFPVEKWTPELGEEYYVPTPISIDNQHFYSTIWENDEIDNHRLANNVVCRTKEEAIALTDKMLGAMK